MTTQDWTTVDEAIKSGFSSMEIWTLVARARGLSLAEVVHRRQALKSGSLLPCALPNRMWKDESQRVRQAA